MELISRTMVITVAFWIAAICPAMNGLVAWGQCDHPGIDFDGDGDVDSSNFTDFAGNFTGAFRNGEGSSRPEDGDIDGDRDVDYIDLVRFLECWETALPSCSSYSSILRYDPATGRSILHFDGVRDCTLAGFALESESDVFQLEDYLSSRSSLVDFRGGNRTYQIGAWNTRSFGDTVRDYRLGRILPVGLTQESLESSISVGWAVSGHKLPHVEMDLIALPMPALGDTDRDSDVDTVDQLTLMEHWTGAQEPGTAGKIFDEGDFDFDEDVDTNDMLILIEGWTGAASERFIGPVITDSASSVLSVPEPTSPLAWLVPTIVAITCGRRHERSKLNGV
jgi:hypothetical protein